MYFERVRLPVAPDNRHGAGHHAMAPYRVPLGVSTDDQDIAADDGDKDQENKQSRSLAQEAGPFRHLYIRAASALKNTPNEGRLEKAEYRVL